MRAPSPHYGPHQGRECGAASLALPVLLLLFVGSVAGISFWTDKVEEALDGQRDAGDSAVVADAGSPPRATGSFAMGREPLTPGTWVEDPQPGLMLALRGALSDDGPVDHRVAEQAALAIERGRPVSPFLKPQPFVAEWTGTLEVAIRDRYQFRALGQGNVVLTVGDKELLNTQLAGKWIETKARRLRKGSNPVVITYKGPALGRANFRLWWRTSEGPWEPLSPKVTRHDAAHPHLVAATELRRGRALFAEMRCSACHDAKPGRRGMPEVAERGPALIGVGSRLRTAWMEEWLRDPAAARADVRMPDLLHGEAEGQEAADLAAWLGSLGKPPADLPTGNADDGKHRFEQLGCLSCHTAPGAATENLELEGRIGLDHVVHKWYPAALRAFLKDPRGHDPASRMPDFGLSDEELDDIVAFLTQGDANTAAPTGDAARGEALAVERRCVTCHDVGVDVAAPLVKPLAKLAAPTAGCLADAPGADVPHYQLTADDRKALAAFIQRAPDSVQRHVPLEYSQRQLEVLRCVSCHAYGDTASLWSAVMRELPLDPDEMQEGAGLAAPPMITWVGGKLRPQWLTKFLQGGVPKKPRPWLQIRMPAFPVRGADMAAGLTAMHGYQLKENTEPEADVTQSAAGLKLIGPQGFNCITCHGNGAQPATQVFETQGVNFALIHERLQYEYYERWMVNPGRIDADSRMPKYSNEDGDTQLIEVLDGDAAKQYRAIWEFLRSSAR